MKGILDFGFRIVDSGKGANDSLASTRDKALRNSKSEIRNPKSIEIHIDEMVLHGFAMADRYSIADAVQHELARLLAENGAPSSLAQPAAIERISGGAFRLKSDANAESTGAQVARAIFGGLRR